MNSTGCTSFGVRKNISVKDNPVRNAVAKMVSTVVIAPGSTRTVSIYPSNDILCPTLVFESNKWLQDKGIVAEIQEVSGFDGTMPITLRNESMIPRRLYADRKIGSLIWRRPANVSVGQAEKAPMTRIEHVLPNRPREEADIK